MFERLHVTALAQRLADWDALEARAFWTRADELAAAHDAGATWTALAEATDRSWRTVRRWALLARDTPEERRADVWLRLQGIA